MMVAAGVVPDGRQHVLIDITSRCFPSYSLSHAGHAFSMYLQDFFNVMYVDNHSIVF